MTYNWRCFLEALDHDPATAWRALRHWVRARKEKAMPNLELGVWGDGTIRLAHWDAEHGDDTFIIVPNSDAEPWTWEKGGETELVTGATLAEMLREWAIRERQTAEQQEREWLARNLAKIAEREAGHPCP